MAKFGWKASGVRKSHRIRFLIAGALAVITALWGMALWAQSDTVLKVNVRLVNLLVTVRDQNGALVGNLTRDEFHVRDRAIEQKVAVFEKESAQPLSVAILIDTSGSTAKDLRYETDSVGRFARALFASGNPRDQAALYSFNYEINQRVGFTRHEGTIDHALRLLHGEAGTSLYDALYLAADDLFDREGRHVIVVVTDGGDTTSSKNFNQMLERVQNADTIVYAILVVPIENMAGRNIGGENALITLTSNTGGKVFEPSLATGLDRSFSQILDELRSQYRIAYYPKDIPSSRERFHKISVETARPGLRISTRAGYYEEAEAPR
jgi:Ca-activated chloride channel family protein